MYYLDSIKKRLSEAINQYLKEKLISADDFATPPSQDMGDLSLPCFKLAKQLGKSSAQIAEELMSNLETDKSIIGYKTAGPYLNFILAKDNLARNVINEISEKQTAYGKNQTGQNKKVMVEFSNANTHKEYHVGHLRNLTYGDAVVRLLSANGYDAIPVSYINDFGIHVAKTLWCFNEYYKNEAVPENKGFFLGKIYARAAEELKENKIGAQLVGGIMKKIESRAGEEFELWKKTRDWSIEQFASIYDELGIKFVRTFYESEFIDEGLKTVNKLLADGILKKSDGAVIADLEEYGLGVLVVLRSDGTALYPVADLPLAIHKINEFALDESIYVVDIRQGLYFKQLFKILELLGFKQNLKHLGYEFVKLPTGMMSSRSGNVIPYEELRSALIEHEINETAERHPDWPREKIKKTAATIAKAVIKFEMNKVSASSIISFDIDNALRFDGYTAVYLLYTYARLQSIIRKSDTLNTDATIDLNLLTDAKEHSIALKLASYPDVVKKAGANFDPSEITKYLFEFAQALNDYYHSIPILKADAPTSNARLALISSACRVITNALSLLGIDTLDEM